jgi:hypothetical protein
MRCQVEHRSNENVTDRTRPLGPSEPVQHAVPMAVKEPRFRTIRYLEHPDDATALRKLLVSDEWIAQHMQPGKLYVGVIQRTKSRSFLDIDALIQAIREAFPKDDMILNVTTLDTPSIVEQAQWFSTKDVVFAAHGAALTNSIFLRPKSVVMQFYAKGFWLPSLDPLVEQSGSVALDWYPGKAKSKDPQLEMSKNTYRAKLITNLANISFVGGGSKEIDVDTIIRPVLDVLISLGKIH